MENDAVRYTETSVRKITVKELRKVRSFLKRVHEVLLGRYFLTGRRNSKLFRENLRERSCVDNELARRHVEYWDKRNKKSRA